MRGRDTLLGVLARGAGHLVRGRDTLFGVLARGAGHLVRGRDTLFGVLARGAGHLVRGTCSLVTSISPSLQVYMSSSNPSDLNTLINFCFNPFVAGISSEAVTADGCSPSNLVADDPRFRSQGLRVEHFIRPPVTITIDLCVPVAVSCILLCPDLPQGAELRVELSGAVKGNSVLHRLTAGPVMITSGSVLVARSTQCYRAMASVVTLANLVVHSSCSKDLAKCNHIESPLKLVNVLRQLRHLQLTVTRWTGAKPVSIKWLEVWGVVSTACSRKEAAIFDAKLKASMCSPSPCQQQPPKMYGKQSPDQTGIKHSSVSNSLPSTSHGTAAAPPTRKQDATSQDVPEQFLDELTFELMVLPMLLPSGHCVDQSTVDRLASNDALYGRPPTDPFTGQLLP